MCKKRGIPTLSTFVVVYECRRSAWRSIPLMMYWGRRAERQTWAVLKGISFGLRKWVNLYGCTDVKV